jgi:dTDP-glucose 4,6-dehydratase
MRILVTGGAGFIGSALIRYLILKLNHEVVCFDKFTYASSIEGLASVLDKELFSLERKDITNTKDVEYVFDKHKPDKLIHLAAETHVDRSIDGPRPFIETNIVGTYNLLEESLKYWNSLDIEMKTKFRFHHVSTDEVFGDLKIDDEPFDEKTPYNPSSPYSSSKASSDHLVRAWNRTYGLPIVLSNCSNNYGPFQHPEKLIPLVLSKAIAGEQIPIYGKGDQIRDWLYVEDHAEALIEILNKGKIGESYNIGGNCEVTNLQLVKTLCQVLDRLTEHHPNGVKKYEDLISFVQDRPGHDKRYAINALKIKQEIHWEPNENLETGLEKTVAWYLANQDWLEDKQQENFNGNRLGVLK